MKRTLHSVIFLTSMLLLLFCLSGCSALEKMTPESDGHTAYGVDLPSDCWVTDCILLSEEPELEKLLGTGGESGLLSDYAIKNDGKGLGDYSGDYFDPGYLDYLVCLFYWDADNIDLTLDTYLKFTLVTDTQVLYDWQCVDVREHSVRILDADLEASVEMGRIANRLAISGTTGDSYTLGALVIPFQVEQAGTLYVDLRLEYAGPHTFSKTYIDSTAVAEVGLENTSKTRVSVENMTINYLTEESYQNGNYSEADLMSAPSMDAADICYMVLDAEIKTHADNNGQQSINLLAYVPEATFMDATIESTPTGRTEEAVVDGVTSIRANYTIPATADSVKKIRMVLKLESRCDCITDVNIFLVGDEGTITMGKNHVTAQMVAGTPTIRCELSADGTYYTVTGLWKHRIEELIIPDTYMGLPVTYVDIQTCITLPFPNDPPYIDNYHSFYWSSNYSDSIYFYYLIDNPYITSLYIGKNVVNCDLSQFKLCKSLEKIVIAGHAWAVENSYNFWPKLQELEYHGHGFLSQDTMDGYTQLHRLVLGDGVTQLEENLFEGFDNLQSVTLSPNITEIPDGCFRGCSSLTTIQGGSRISSVGDYAFEGCTNLETLDFGQLTSIGEGAFQGCSSLQKFGTVNTSTIANYAFADCSSLPWFNLSGVVTIGEYAFQNCKAFDRIVIPNSCEQIDEGAFFGTSNVKSLHIGRNLRTVEFGLLSDKTSLETISVNPASETYYVSGNCLLEKRSVWTLSYGYYAIGPELVVTCKNSVIPDDVVIIGVEAFSNRHDLTTLSLPEHVQVIASHAFENCSELQTISLPEKIVRIDSSAFAGCNNLQSIALPVSLISIGSSAFAGCSSLQSISIPDSVEEIGREAFWDCTSLAEVTMSSDWYIAKYSYPVYYANAELHIDTKKDAAEYLRKTYYEYMFSKTPLD